MALKEYLGAIVMEIDGKEIEIESLDVTHKTGRKLVKTMNRSGRAAGYSKGVEEYDLKVTAVIPAEGDLIWSAIVGAKITVYPVTGNGKRTTYQDCFVTDVGSKYTVDSEAKRDLTLIALNEVTE